MLQTQLINPFVFVVQTPTDHNEVSRLLAAAVVDHQFRDLLLSDPGTAMDQGYLGESFYLTSEERRMILSIHAESLRAFANQLVYHLACENSYLQENSFIQENSF